MTLTPLITAAEGFPALERLAAGAQEELLLSFRIFDPQTKLRAPELREQGLETWADLLAVVAGRGVRIRMVLADFDPLFTSDLHRTAWASANGFASAVPGDFQVLCAPHGQTVGWLWRTVFRPKILEKLHALQGDDPKKLTPLQKKVLTGPAVLRPVTLHQKCAVADSRICIIGGLDVNDRRYDDWDHDRPSDETWHDVAMQVEGAFAVPLRAHLIETWNAAIDCGAESPGQTAERMEVATASRSAGDLQLVRTLSAPCQGFSVFGPRARITEHEEVLIKAIDAARDSIYIETQFLRHRPIAEALARAAAREPDLNCIIILPPQPDRVLFDGDTGWDARHAEALQLRALEKIRDAFGDRVAMISPAKTAAAEKGEAEVYGAGPIYIHAKVMLIDEDFGLVGSANLNGRSLHWDTEASVLFRNADTIRDMRQRFALKWLAEESEGQDITRAEIWSRTAEANKLRAPQDRTSFALPYPFRRVRRFSRHLPILPSDMF
ncbi:hypothetical protein P775_17510 [Puniceibacterium antarcticum]|uniref:Phospholipase D n=1 Tax=Puniceibacterium antarcticum TaxID=1206336 RepID=A0A2G8RBB8_9RHOB|nr:phospholipase D-like domain-containing protein [Puniceibacterium antarcticum]PIL18840.1 hypothetical protein P775_17510 [Puniceibacterium antarcticum]